MDDIVLIPCWRRPELLALCLERLRAADGAESARYIIAIDRDPDRDMRAVAESLPFEKAILELSHGYPGNSFNVLEGLRSAVVQAKGNDRTLVHVIEEDVLVARDYFRFHRMAHETFRPFCVTACESMWNMANGMRGKQEKAWVYMISRYQGPNASFRPAELERVLPYATAKYYGAPTEFLERSFPDSQIGWGNGEQDILISNVVRRDRLQMVVPFMARAYHAGWYGLGGGDAHPPRGNLQQRIDAVRRTLDVPAAIELANPNVNTVRPVPLDGIFAPALELREFEPMVYAR